MNTMTTMGSMIIDFRDGLQRYANRLMKQWHAALRCNDDLTCAELMGRIDKLIEHPEGPVEAWVEDEYDGGF